MSNAPIRNVRAFIHAYFKSDAGKAALTRKDVRHKTPSGEIVTIKHDSSMAIALRNAAN